MSEPVVPQPVQIRVGAMVTVNGPPSIIQGVIEHNTFANPEYTKKERLGLWTGNVGPTITLYRRIGAGGLEVPRGTFPFLIRRCREAGQPFTIQNTTVAPPLSETLCGGHLYPYQVAGLQQLLAFETGLLEAPTGSGKTNILLSVIPKVNTTTLILTHTKELFAQTRTRCLEWLGYDPGAIGGGLWQVKPITVAMVQTLARRGLGDLHTYFGCVLVDEAHHAPAKMWAALLNELPARFKYGFTATAFRKDGLQMLMWRTIGNVTARITREDVERAGTIVTPDVELVETNFWYDLSDSTDWSGMITALIRDPQRNALIASEVRRHLGAHRRAVVLSDRVEHVHLLAERLANLNPVVLTGELPRAARDAAMAAVRNGARLTIATTSLLGEGVDVPGWDVLFLATPIAGGPRTLQAVGRVSRAAPGKTSATVVDFLDPQVPALVASHLLRERMYART